MTVKETLNGKVNWSMTSVIVIMVVQFTVLVWHAAKAHATIETNTIALVRLTEIINDVGVRTNTIDSIINARQQVNMYRIDRLEDAVHLRRVEVH
jgi:hypothetical protein